MPARTTTNGFETGIVTRDGNRLASFYRDILGFKELTPMSVPGFCHIHRMAFGRTILRIVEPEQPPLNDHAGGEFMASTGFRYLIMVIDNVEETVEEVRAAGCSVPVPPWEVRPGRLVCQVQDPDGNHVELIEITEAST